MDTTQEKTARMPRNGRVRGALRPFILRCARGVLVTTLVGGALAGCGASAGLGRSPAETAAPTPATAALPAGVQVELFQLRSDVADRSAQVRVSNDSDEDLVITGLTVHDDWFAGPAVRDRTSTVASGRTVDLRFALPESACDGEPDAATRTSRVVLDLEGGESVSVDVTNPLGFTTLVHQKECLRHDLAEVATLEWTSFTPSDAPRPAQLVLAVTPSDDSAVLSSAELTDVQTTNLLQFADQPRLSR